MKRLTLKQLERREWWWRKGSDWYRWNPDKSQFDFTGQKIWMKVFNKDEWWDSSYWDKSTHFSRASYAYELARRGRTIFPLLPRWDQLEPHEQGALQHRARQKAYESGAEYTVFSLTMSGEVRPKPGFVVLDKWAWNLAASPKQLAKEFLAAIASAAKEAGITPRKKGEKNANRRESWRVIEVLDLHFHRLTDDPAYNSGQASSGLRKAIDAEREFAEFLKDYRNLSRAPSSWDGINIIDAHGS